MEENKLIKWEAVKQSIAECVNVDEIAQIRDKAESVRYALKQAGEAPEVIRQAEEIKLRAERRAGEIIIGMKEDGKILEHRPSEEVSQGVTLLSDYDISRNESSKWQKIALLPINKFEEFIATAPEISTAGAIRVLNDIRQETEYETKLNNTASINTDKIYQVIYADPPWSYENMTPLYVSRPGDYYQQMSVDNIYNFPVQKITDTDAVLFLWVPSPLLEKGLHTIHEWGFEYKANFVWDKVKHNMGYYNSVRHEFLFLAIKGSYPLQNKKLFDSVITEPRTKHSVKPKIVYEIIETIYPKSNKIELFARNKRKGWDSYGNEV